MAEEDDYIFDGLKFSNPEPSAILYEGLLKKKSPQAVLFLRPWQERYCRLTANVFFYYRDKDLPYQGAIPLSIVSTIDIEPDRHRFHMILDSEHGRTFSFTAKKDTFSKWITVLSRAHEEARRLKRSVPQDGGAIPDDQGPGASTGKKLWKNIDDKKGSGPIRQTSVLQPYLPPQFLSSDWVAQSGKPTYTLFHVPARAGLFDSCPNLCKEVFGSYKIQSEEQVSEIGTVYTIGDDHYAVTHRSYLMHCVFKSNPNFPHALSSMDTARTLAEFPLFPTQISHGETSDAVYAIYHPPVRLAVDSLFSWLEREQSLPEPVVQWLAMHLLLAFEFIHPMGIQLITLTPETLFFDGDGIPRIIDLMLSQALSTSVPEYTPPEVVLDGYESATTAADYWRLGILLYELAVGVPPVRSDQIVPSLPTEGLDSQQIFDNEQQEIRLYEESIYEQLRSFKPGDLLFPPFVSQPLQQLIAALLHPLPQQRLCDPQQIKSHAFFASVPAHHWSLDQLLQLPRPQWVEETILEYLHDRQDTPANLTFKPECISLQRITVSVKSIRGLPRHVAGHRMYSIVTIDGDVQQTPIAQPMTAPDESGELPLINDVLEISGDLTFDLVHGYHFSQASSIIIEIVSQDRESRGVNGVIGAVLYPIRDLRNNLLASAWFVIYDANGIPQGEARIEMSWETVLVELNAALLSSLSDTTKSFPEWFGTRVAPPPNKLYSLIVDNSLTSSQDHELQHNMAAGLTSQLLMQANASQFTNPNGTPSLNPRSPMLLPTTASGSTPLMQPGTPPQFALRSSPSLAPISASGRGSHGSSHDGSGSPLSLHHPAPLGTPSRQDRTLDSKSSGTAASHTDSAPRGSATSSTYFDPASGPASQPNSTSTSNQYYAPRSSLPATSRPPPFTHHQQQQQQQQQYNNHNDDLPPVPPPPPPEAFQQQSVGAMGTSAPALSHSPSAPAAISGSTVPSSSSTPPPPPDTSGLQDSQTSPEPEEDPDDIPANWKPIIDKDSGDTYYYNRVTKNVTWDPPPCAVALLLHQKSQRRSS